MSGVRSASVGVWVRYGSAHEAPEALGAAHLLEHMVFKGTAGRSAREIAAVLERLGGSLDAYTSREHTAFQARVLDEHLELALDVLAEMVARPSLRAEDLRIEREVVLEEIATVEDTPDDLVFELHTAALWPDHPYGHSILGTRATVGSCTADGLRSTHRGAYRRPNLVVAAAGAVEHDDVVAAVAGLFDGVPDGGSPPAVAAGPPAPVGERRVERAGTQAHIVMGGRSIRQADPRRYALVLLSNAVGGGMSSRLFQRVREELGLAYAVFTFQSFYRTGGTQGVYVGTRPEWADRAVDVIRDELAAVAADGLTAAELDDAKGQVKGQMVLDLESPGGRVARLALQELYDEPRRTVGELIERIGAVTLDDIAEVAAEYMDPERWLTVRLGPAH
ncbi:MAG: M16 family metallopeptidase [Candidatus Longimicrobiales bacterium M2_2A_002]